MRVSSSSTCRTFPPFEFGFYIYIFYIYSPPFHLREKVSFPCTCWSSCFTERAAWRPFKSEWFRSINCADSSDERTGSCKQRSLACEISTRTVIGRRSSCCEPAPNSTDHEIINNSIVEQPCSLWARSNTETAPLRATISLKVVINESSVYHCLTILKQYC